MCADSNQLAQVGGGGPVRSYKIFFVFFRGWKKVKEKSEGLLFSVFLVPSSQITSR